jgi:alpha-L-rhamnosidase
MNCHLAIPSFSVFLCFLLAVTAAEDTKVLEAIVSAPALTPDWTSPDGVFIHGNPAPGWPEVRPEARPGSYWWWPASAVTKGDLTWNLETYQKAGWGNMGVIGIYGVKGEEKKSIPIFTPEWFAMFNHSVAEAKRLGMNVDLTPSSGWRLGGPHVTKEHSERSFAVKNGTIEVTERTDKVKRAGPGGEGMCINPYSPAAVKFHFDWLADRFREGKGLAPRAFYYDSFENSGNWAPELPDRFKQLRAYDINDHAPALGGTGDPEEVRRVMHDYQETLSDLLLDCVGIITQWGEERESGLRMQAHGAPANLLDMYAAASIPETEVFGANKFDIPSYRRDPLWSLDQPHSEMVHRFASSAAHVAGRNLVISESFTWLRNHFHTALSHMKAEADRLLLCGVNGIYYHGTCFSPEKTEWPGWLFYAATQVNVRNSIFRDIPALNVYLSRCQSVLQQGKPHNDVLLYWPVSDLWMQGGKREQRFSVHHSDWIEKSACGEAGRWLMQQGHSFDFVSDAQLGKARLENKLLITEGGSAYRTILVPAAKFMHVQTARQLLKLADAGATIAIWKSLPQSVPGWHNYVDRERELKDMLGSLNFMNGVAKVGQGRLLFGDDLAALLSQTGIAREEMVDHGLKYIRRKLPGEVIYFIANQSANRVDAWVPIASPCRSAVLMDPMTGAVGKARTRSAKAATEVYLQLEPGESRIMRALAEKDADGPPWPVLKPSGEPLVVNGPWEIRFVEGGPVLPAPATMPTLASWTILADPEAQRFAGAACYSTTVTRSGLTSDRWLLDLGDVRESARVRINGKPAGVLVAHPFRLDVSGLLKAGANTIEIEVTNLSANRIRDLDRRKVGWKKFHEINIVDHNYKKLDATVWPDEPSGLLGPVRLIPFSGE